MKQLEVDLSKKPNFKCRRENWRTRRKPMEASLDWKPNAHKCQDRESNLGLIGAKRGQICYMLTCFPLMLTYFSCWKSFLKYCALYKYSGTDPGFSKRRGAQIKDWQHLWEQKVSVPPQKQRNSVIFIVNLHDLVHFYCRRHPHKVRHPIFAKIEAKIEGLRIAGVPF